MMSKDDTLALKGWAILMMMYLHLFIGWGGYKSIFIFSQSPIESHLVTFSNLCVHIFVFLSGYGLHLSGKGFCDQAKRIGKLYMTFLPIFLLGSLFYLHYTENPIIPQEFLLNAICISHSYNNHWWFIPMYVIFLILFPILKKTISFPLITLSLLIILKVVGKSILRDYDVYVGYNLIKCGLFLLYVVTAYLVVFYAGIICAKDTCITDYFNTLYKVISSKKYLCVVVVFLIVVISDVVPYFGVFAFALVPFLLPALLGFSNGNIVKLLGKLSIYIWLAHFFMLLSIRDYLNSLEYSILIYPVFVLYCILLAQFCMIFCNIKLNK